MAFNFFSLSLALPILSDESGFPNVGAVIHWLYSCWVVLSALFFAGRGGWALWKGKPYQSEHSGEPEALGATNCWGLKEILWQIVARPVWWATLAVLAVALIGAIVLWLQQIGLAGVCLAHQTPFEACGVPYIFGIAFTLSILGVGLGYCHVLWERRAVRKAMEQERLLRTAKADGHKEGLALGQASEARIRQVILHLVGLQAIEKAEVGSKDPTLYDLGVTVQACAGPVMGLEGWGIIAKPAGSFAGYSRAPQYEPVDVEGTQGVVVCGQFYRLPMGYQLVKKGRPVTVS